MHYSADPEKDPAKNPAWLTEAMEGVPKREWEREMEGVDDSYDGEPVYADYSDEWHCPIQFRTQAIPIVAQSIYICSLDCGMTLVPAATLLQITPSLQVHAMLEIVSQGGEPMETFAPRVLREVQKRLPGSWDEVQYCGDATVKQRAGTDGKTAQDVARRFGMRIKPISNEWQGRFSAVTWLLKDTIDENTMRFLIDGKNCPTLRQGFKGAYRYETLSRGDVSGPGRILAMPLKNSFSHIHDALQAGAIVARKHIQGR